MRLLAILSALFLSQLAQAAEDFDTKFVIIDQNKLYVQVAQTPIQREKGLMNRQRLKPYDGMLFVFESPQRVTFWMKDTTIPLVVGFFDHNGVLLETHDMLPLSNTPITSFSNDILYALELPAGGFAKHNIHIGQKIFVP